MSSNNSKATKTNKSKKKNKPKIATTILLECQSWLALWTYTASAIEYSDPSHFPRKHRGGMGAAL